MRLPIASALVLLVSLPCLADRVVLKGGSEITGVVMTEERDDANQLVSITIALRQGGLITLKGADVLSIDRDQKTPWQEYDERSGKAGNDADARLALAVWCRERGLGEEAAAELMKVLDLRPDDEGALDLLAKLGWVRERAAEGEWRWVTPEELQKRRAEARAASQPDPANAAPPSHGTPPAQDPFAQPGPPAPVVPGGDMRIGDMGKSVSLWRLPCGGTVKAKEILNFGWGNISWFGWSDPSAPRRKKPAPAPR